MGIWLGMPGRYEQTREELDRSLDEKGERRKLKKRSVNPLAWATRRAARSEVRARAQTRRKPGLNLENPDDR